MNLLITQGPGASPHQKTYKDIDFLQERIKQYRQTKGIENIEVTQLVKNQVRILIIYNPEFMEYKKIMHIKNSLYHTR